MLFYSSLWRCRDNRLSTSIAWHADRIAIRHSSTYSTQQLAVFDTSHNKCRLIATIKYRWRMVYIRRILSHAEYDEKEWQKS